MFDVLNDWVGRQLSTSSAGLGFLFLFVGGVLASLLPCVYPLYPITAAILRSRRSRFGSAAHPAAYFVGLACVYGILGFIAAVTGGAFNAWMRSPTVNLGLGVLLGLLALATAGLLEFPMMQLNPTENREQSLGSTWLMGAAAGFMSSACVGPVVVGVLVAMAAHTEELAWGRLIVAAGKMFVFGLGVGLPIVLIGVFGLRLPRSGPWMLVVQWGFALLIGYFAIGYMGKGLSGWGFDATSIQLILVGLAAAWCGGFALHPDKPTSERTRGSLAIVAVMLGFLLMNRGLTNAASTSTAEVPTDKDGTEKHGDLSWYLDDELAFAEAERTGKLVFIDFYGNWCTNCHAFERRTLADEDLHAALRKAVLVKIYDTSATFAKYRDDSRFPELRVGLPFFIVTDPKGNLLYKTADYTKTKEMALFLSG